VKGILRLSIFVCREVYSSGQCVFHTDDPMDHTKENRAS
jgi:hypothetical protein